MKEERRRVLMPIQSRWLYQGEGGEERCVGDENKQKEKEKKAPKTNINQINSSLSNLQVYLFPLD